MLSGYRLLPNFLETCVLPKLSVSAARVILESPYAHFEPGANTMTAASTNQFQRCNRAKRVALEVCPSGIPPVQPEREPPCLLRLDVLPRLPAADDDLFSRGFCINTEDIAGAGEQRFQWPLGLSRHLFPHILQEESGKLANVPPASLEDHENSGARNGLTCLKAPATKERRPRTDFNSLPTTPPCCSLLSIQLQIQTRFDSLMPREKVATSR